MRMCLLRSPELGYAKQAAGLLLIWYYKHSESFDGMGMYTQSKLKFEQTGWFLVGLNRNWEHWLVGTCYTCRHNYSA